MIAIIDYDAGNLRSVQKALESLGEEAVITRDKKVIMNADKTILPGVGSFGDCMNKLNQYSLVPVIKDYVATKKPFLGICLGLQLIFEGSDESPNVNGIGLLKGKIIRIPDNEGLKIPQIGWNSLNLHKVCNNEYGDLFKDMADESYVYFVHSYYLHAEDRDIVTATTEYGVTIDVSVQSENIYACQFHPEKSGKIGLKILKNFVSLGKEV